MRWLNPFRVSLIAIAALLVTLPSALRAVDTATVRTDHPSNIVIGFVGGFVDHDNPHHGPVKLAKHIRQSLPKGTYVRVFENRRRREAYVTVFRLLDVNRDGVLSPEEKSRARIVLFGHSWGAAAAVLLARDLQRDGVPVLLTVQVDSVAKLWQNDGVIPDNVAEAINYYQTQGIVHGRRQIAAADPSKTAILGNYRVDYRKDPVACPDASLWDRVFTPGHMQSECDPSLWLEIEGLMVQRLSAQPGNLVVSQTQPSQPAQ